MMMTITSVLVCFLSIFILSECHGSSRNEISGDINNGVNNENLKPVKSVKSNQEQLFVDQPIQLVVPDIEHKKLVLLEENIQLLNQIKMPVAVVSVVGKFHSGKSFLMNQLMKKPNGFGVGPSVQPKTMGIWMWGKPSTMTLDNGEKIAVIFLDTEGFAANNVTENYDAKIFAVATLLSSQLLYNSVKIIDQADIDYLEVLARRTQLFALHSQMSRSKWTNDLNENLLNFPPLIWVVQDFYQDTVDGETPQEWLRRLMLTHARDSDSYQISILDIFRSVDCHTLFLPAITRKLLNNLALASESDLTEEYRAERDALKRKIKQQIRPKQKSNKPLYGPELAILLRVLVNAANEGSLPDVPSRWDSFVERIQKTATDDCLKFYEEEFRTMIADKSGGNPIKPAAFNEWHMQTKKKSIDLLRHLLHGLEDTLKEGLNLLENSIEVIYERNKEINDKKIKLRLVEIQNHIELAAEQSLAELDLPTSTEKLQKSFTQITETLSKRYLREISDFVDVDKDGQIEKLLASVLKTIKIHTGNTQLRNNKKVQQLLEALSNETLEQYSKLAADGYSTEGKPRKPALLEKILDKAYNVSMESYHKRSAKYVNEDIYVPQLALLNADLNAKRKQVESENEQFVDKFMKHQAAKYLDVFVDRTGSNHISLPVNDSDLSTRLSREVNKVMRDFESSMTDFVEYASYTTVYHKLYAELKKVCEQRKLENIKAFTREVERPLESAKKLILLSADKYTTVFSFKKFIREVCLLNLDEGKPKLWPVQLKIQIIDNFMETTKEIKEQIDAKEGFISRIIGWLQWFLWVLGFSS